jgi:hypothetical protein
MEFQTDAQKACYERVKPWVEQVFGERGAIPRDDIPLWYIPMGSAIAQLIISPWGDDDATVGCRAYVVTGARLSQDLMHFLLRANDTMRFGAFGLDQDDDIYFEYRVVGSTIDKPEVKAVALAVAGTADEYDDKIISRWGGESALERMQSSE